MKGFNVKHNHAQSEKIFKQESDKIKEKSELAVVKDAVNLQSSAGQNQLKNQILLTCWVELMKKEEQCNQCLIAMALSGLSQYKLLL